jgi:hypothetical protein
MDNTNPTVYKVAARSSQPENQTFEYQSDLDREEVSAQEIFGEWINARF